MTELGSDSDRRAPVGPPISWEGALLEEVIAGVMDTRQRAGHHALAAEYARARDEAYGAGMDRRIARLDALNVRMALSLGIERPLVQALSRFGATLARVSALVIVTPPPGEEEGADLRAGPTLVLATGPGRWIAAAGGRLESLDVFLDHELLHVADMLAPGFFGPLPHAGPGAARGAQDWPGRTRGQQEQVRRAYRALWCASIDARIERVSSRPLESAQERRSSLERAFGAAMLEDAQRALDTITGTGAAAGAAAPTSEQRCDPAHDPRAASPVIPPAVVPVPVPVPACPSSLVAAAGAGALASCAAAGLTHQGLLDQALRLCTPASPEGAGLAHRRAAGMCPLCTFPTVQWAEAQALPPAVIDALVADAPGWSPGQGLCAHCAQGYLVRTLGLIQTARPSSGPVQPT